MAGLPEWQQGTPAVLCVAGPHAIPVSTFVRVGPERVMLALGRKRETLRRLREDPSVELCLLGKGLALTAHGSAAVVRDPMKAAPLTAVELRVASVQDHLADGRTEMLDGARWRWLDAKAAESEGPTLEELRALAG